MYLKIEGYHLFDYWRLMNFESEARRLMQRPGRHYGEKRKLLDAIGIKRKILSQETRTETGEIVTLSRRIFTPDIDDMFDEVCGELLGYLSKYKVDFERDEAHLFGKSFKGRLLYSPPQTQRTASGLQLHLLFL